MKACVAQIALVLLLVGSSSATDQQQSRSAMDQVISMLNGMLDKSASDAKVADENYEREKCYCESNQEEKTESLKAVKDQIQVLNSDIDRLAGSTAELSQESIMIKTDMDANAAARQQAGEIRAKETALFQSTETELASAVDAMSQAVNMLDGISGSSLAQGSVHTKFMSSRAALVKANANIKEALFAASAFLPEKDRAQVDSFLQGTATSEQSGSGITEVLRKMKDTFAENLAAAQQNERTAEGEYQALKTTKERTFASLESAYAAKQSLLATDGDELAAKRAELRTSQTQQADDEAFLANLEADCKSLNKEYEDGKLFRSNEDAAIAKAISILTSEEAYSSFSKVTATLSLTSKGKKLSLLQRSMTTAASHKSLEQQLIDQARSLKSQKLSHVAVMLQQGNPFTKVFEEIDKMIAAIDSEGQQDVQQRDWCSTEQSSTSAALAERESEVSAQNSQVLALQDTINAVGSGLNDMIASNEASLEQNTQDKAHADSTRKAEQDAYVVKLKEVADAKQVLQKAIDVLSAYYTAHPTEGTAATELVQTKKAPAQSAEGNQVLSMLDFILEETTKEGNTATANEDAAKTAYDTTVATLAEAATNIGRTLADLRADLAQKNQELDSAQADLSVTSKGKETLENYIASIQPGCNFISTNFALREDNRDREKEALQSAKMRIEASPVNAAYAAAPAAA